MMRKDIKDYLIDRTSELAFITIKDNAELGDMEFEMPDGEFRVPVKSDVIVEGVKGNMDEAGISMMSIVDGMLYIIGIDPDFIYNKSYEGFLRAFSQRTGLNPGELAGFKSKEAFEKGDAVDALIYIRALTAIDSSSLAGYYHEALICQELAERYNKDNDIDAVNAFLLNALLCLEKCIELDDSFELSYYQLGFHYMNQNQFQKAKMIWEKALELGIDEEYASDIRQLLESIKDKVSYEIGYMKILNGKSEEGLEILRSLEEKYPDWWNLLFMIGLGYKNLGDIVNAMKYFNKIITIMPDQIDSIVELGLLEAHLGNLNVAAEYFERALKLKEDPEVLCNLGMTYLYMGDLDSASYHINRAHELDPLDEITVSCLRELEKYMNGEE